MTWPADFPIYFGRGIPGPFGNSPAPTVSTLVYDTFTDSNGTNLSAHTPDTKPAGSAWTSVDGVMQISSNRAIWVSNSANNIALYRINAGKADATVSCVARFVGNGPNVGIGFRVEGVNDWLIATISNSTVYILKRIPGLNVVATKAQARTAGVDYGLQLTVSGGNISFKINGVEELTATDAFNGTITYFGLYSDGVAGAQFDNFQVVG